MDLTLAPFELICLEKRFPTSVNKYSCILFLLNLFLCVGGKLVYLYTKKPGKVPRCGDCKSKLQGVSIRQTKF